MKRCCICKQTMSSAMFSKNRTCKDGLRTECKECMKQYKLKYNAANKQKIAEYKKLWRLKRRPVINAYNAAHKVIKLKRTPAWLNAGHLFELECIYTYAHALNSVGLHYHVDHRIPLQGEVVSGLHVPENLQVITAEENLKKGNKYDETS